MSGILPTPTDNLLSLLEQAIQVQLRKEQAQRDTASQQSTTQTTTRIIKIEPSYEVEPLEAEPEDEPAESNACPWMMDIRIQQVIEAVVTASGEDHIFALHALADCHSPRHAFTIFVEFFGLDKSIELVNRIKEALEDAAVAEMVRADQSEVELREYEAAVAQKAEARKAQEDAACAVHVFTTQFETAAAASEQYIAQVKAGYILPDCITILHNKKRVQSVSEQLKTAEAELAAAEAKWRAIIVPSAPAKFVPAPYDIAASFMDSCSCIPSTVRPGVPEDVWLISTDKLRRIIVKTPRYPTALTVDQRDFITAVIGEMRLRLLNDNMPDRDMAANLDWLITISTSYHPGLLETLRRDLSNVNSRLATGQSQKFDEDVANIMAN